jgi:hypothetical protein
MQPEGTAMTIRRVTAPVLYTQSTSGRWLSSLTAAMDEAAAGLCRMTWLRSRTTPALAPALQPVRMSPPSRQAR